MKNNRSWRNLRAGSSGGTPDSGQDGELIKRALLGDNSARIALGYAYFKGCGGVKKNYNNALYWFEKVELKYDATGFVANHLALIYYKGLGVARDQEKAMKYFRSASLHNHGASKILFAILQKRREDFSRKSRSAEILLRSSVCNPKVDLKMRFLALLWLWF
ncbi:tetratricopeptide repeat protein [Oleiagrimonas soli]|uniref:TPR repeat protein n=1 Tax=Oleiagrimonas soli TaxID=1543381 RepID=A0A841KRP7_9GAMM|nr:SEL1-like repeat protein [Oleiagrimonas soli]MBB6184648.1 TPR repeat protein [Oleiagrimonas soli]